MALRSSRARSNPAPLLSRSFVQFLSTRRAAASTQLINAEFRSRLQEGDSWRDLQLTANLTRPSEHMDGGNAPAVTAICRCGEHREIRFWLMTLFRPLWRRRNT
jgi:hypothetical protein